MWEDRQNGRRERALSKRTRYKTMQASNAAALAPMENPETKEDGEEKKEQEEKTDSTTEENTTSPDGLGGLDEEEVRVAMERRAKMKGLPPITLRGHVVVGGKKGKNGKKQNTHYVAKPNQYLDGVVSTSNDEGALGRRTRHGILSNMLIEQGRRRVIGESQLRGLQENRRLKVERLKERNAARDALLYPKEEVVVVEE